MIFFEVAQGRGFSGACVGCEAGACQRLPLTTAIFFLPAPAAGAGAGAGASSSSSSMTPLRRTTFATGAGAAAGEDLGLVHAFAGFLLARPTGPPAEDVALAERLLRGALAAPGAAAHPDAADASFNLGVIQHLKAVEGAT